MNFNSILIKCRFLTEQGEPKGGEYTYGYKFDSEIPATENGKIVLPKYAQTPDGKKVIITKWFVDEKEVASFAHKLKFVKKYVPSEADK